MSGQRMAFAHASTHMGGAHNEHFGHEAHGHGHMPHGHHRHNHFGDMIRNAGLDTELLASLFAGFAEQAQTPTSASFAQAAAQANSGPAIG